MVIYLCKYAKNTMIMKIFLSCPSVVDPNVLGIPYAPLTLLNAISTSKDFVMQYCLVLYKYLFPSIAVSAISHSSVTPSARPP